MRLKVDVIVTGGPVATRAAKNATKTIPIVMTQDSDPVGQGMSTALRVPAATSPDCPRLAPELSGKRLELLKETVPKLARVAVLGSSTDPATHNQLKETRTRRSGVGGEGSIPGRTSPQGS